MRDGTSKDFIMRSPSRRFWLLPTSITRFVRSSATADIPASLDDASFAIAFSCASSSFAFAYCREKTFIERMLSGASIARTTPAARASSDALPTSSTALPLPIGETCSCGIAIFSGETT